MDRMHARYRACSRTVALAGCFAVTAITAITAITVVTAPTDVHADTPLTDTEMAARLEACAACHGEAGRAVADEYFPSIAGKPAGYLEVQLHNFRAGRRRHSIMEQMLAYLSDEYIAEIAAYYARQTPQWTPPTTAWSERVLERGRRLVHDGDPSLGVPSCAACHGDTLKGVAPYIPSLLGMRAEYLAAQLGAWRSGTRRGAPPDCMAEIAERLASDDLGAVTAYIASQPYPDDPTPQATLEAPLPLECGSVP